MEVHVPSNVRTIKAQLHVMSGLEVPQAMLGHLPVTLLGVCGVSTKDTNQMCDVRMGAHHSIYHGSNNTSIGDRATLNHIGVESDVVLRIISKWLDTGRHGSVLWLAVLHPIPVQNSVNVLPLGKVDGTCRMVSTDGNA